MSRAYSNAARQSASSFFIVTTPQLSGVIPASRYLSASALRSAGESFIGRWTSLIETYETPTRWMAAMAASGFMPRRL